MTSETSSSLASSHAERKVLPGTRFHRARKTIQVFCFIVFLSLPMLNIMRFDLVRQRFYFFGAELSVSEFAILFLSMILVALLVAATAMTYGRFYCGYLCPQMIFSESANGLEKKIRRFVDRRFRSLGAGLRKALWIALFSIALAPASVFLAFVFISYFVPPADLLHRLLSIDLRTSAGLLGASVTLITFLDFALLRQRFCTAICPYGYLQNMLADRQTLLVLYDDPQKRCIHCNACVRACPMGIDIRFSSHQLECTHCAECVDACSGVLGKLGQTTLVRYAWGDTGGNIQEEKVWYRRLGLRDGKRIVILIVLCLYASALSIVISMRKPVLVRIMPDRTTLYTVAPDGQVHNRFRITASNRSHAPATLTLALEGLPQARLASDGQPIILAPSESVQREFDVAAPAGALTPGINRMKILASAPGQKTLSFDENFFAPLTSAMSSHSSDSAPAGGKQ